MKRTLIPALALALSLSLFSGCGKAPEKPNVFTAENEILTYERVDPDKTTLLVSMLGDNAMVKNFSAAFEASNPDVQVVCIDITGGDGAYKPTDDWLRHGMAPDLMFTNAMMLAEEGGGANYLTDLSAHPALTSFEVQSLDALSIDGHVYYLPGPSEVNCMVYNKALFEQYGWQPPKTFDEFVALCDQIRKDTNGEVEPWNPNAKYENVFSTALVGFTYGELFAGVENSAWYDGFCEGRESAEHLAPLYEMMQTLVDNKLIREEHFTYSATTRGNEFLAGKTAMLNHQASAFYYPDGEFDTGFLPFPSTDGKTGYVSTSYSLVLCEPNKEHTDAGQDAVDRYIEFFASVEGQQAIVDKGLLISNVKGMPAIRGGAMAAVEAAIREGNQYSYFVVGDGKRSFSLTANALEMVTGESTGEEIIAAIDASPVIAGGGEPERKSLATVAPGGLTILEFSGYIADMYRERAEADIGLICHGVAYRGNLVRLFEGDIYESYIHVLKPRSFANDATLIKVSMTGRQLMDALNDPGDGTQANVDAIYAFSGLQCEVAPWNAPGEKYLSVKLADGSELDPEKTYTVALWAGTVADKYITETPETYEGTWEELMGEKMLADGAIAPANDGRIKLIWD